MRRKQVAPSHQVHHRGLLALTEAFSGRSCGPAGAGKCAAASSLRPQHFLLLISQAIATHVLRRIQARQQRQQLGGVLPCQRMLTTSSHCCPNAGNILKLLPFHNHIGVCTYQTSMCSDGYENICRA